MYSYYCVCSVNLYYAVLVHSDKIAALSVIAKMDRRAVTLMAAVPQDYATKDSRETTAVHARIVFMSNINISFSGHYFISDEFHIKHKETIKYENFNIVLSTYETNDIQISCMADSYAAFGYTMHISANCELSLKFEIAM